MLTNLQLHVSISFYVTGSRKFVKLMLPRIISKFLIQHWSNVPPHLNHVATLRCDVSLITIFRLFLFFWH